MANQVVFSPESILYYRSGIPGNLSGAKSPNAIISTFSAYKKTTEILLSRDFNLRTRQICANIWQRFLYDFYPNAPDLLKDAESFIKQYGPSTLPFEGGKTLKILTRIFGWKWVRKMQIRLKKY